MSREIKANLAVISRDIDFQDYIRSELQNVVKTLIEGAIPLIRDEARRLIYEELVSSDTYVSLRHGYLREAFGLADNQGQVDKFIANFVQSVDVIYDRQGRDQLGSIEVVFIDSAYSKVLGTGFDYFAGYHSPPSQSFIGWLGWLLFEGDRIVVQGWNFLQDGKKRRASRTGSAIMIEPKRVPASGFNVPPQYAGSRDDNWLTRAVDRIADSVQQVVYEQVLENF